MFSALYSVSVLLNLVVFFREAELQPAFTDVPPNPFTVLEGNNITLEWSYDLAGESFARVEFVEVSSSPSVRILEVSTVGQPPNRLDKDYFGRVQVNVTATHTSITIFGANRTVDSKEYEFEVVPQSSSVVPSVVRISVQYPPEFSSVSDVQDVVEGGPSITLQCIAIGEPPPNITWTRVLNSSSDSDVLFTGEQLVLDNNRNSTGTYRCTAYNGIGTAPNRTIAVDVSYKPENVNLTVNDSSICKGDIISITCSADGKPDVHTYQLFENDTPVPDGDTAGVWKRTMSVQGIFTYRCVANNSVGTSDKNVTVTVNVPAVVYQLENITVTEGDNSTLTCNVSGSPTPSVTWTEVKTGNRSMGIIRELTRINRNQSGEYMCEASNFCGNDSAKTFVTVQYKPENFQFAASKIEVCQEEVINFTCSADGNPAVDTYQLFKNDALVTDGINSHGIWNRTMSTGGVFIYKCVANNTAGTGQSKTLTVTVNVPSAIQPIQNVNITEGENLTLLCNVTGIPSPMVSWIKVEGDMATNKNELVFTNISRTQAGEYKCEASNQCGNSSETVTIEVQYPPDNVKLETSATDNRACRGDIISITCSADAGPSVTSYELFENDTAIFDTSGMWTRNFTTEGTFIYKCAANNSLGTGESESVTVTVNVASSIQPIEKQTVMEGHNLTVVCNVSGIPAPMVTWIKVDGGEPFDGKELVFTHINRSQAGQYKCEASNECGNASETATVEVQFKPDNLQLETSADDNKACRGDVISINCSAVAVPSEISYQLLENEVGILDTSGRWDRPLTTAGMFTYKCVPNNTLGTGENATVTITVNVPSSIQPIQNKTVIEEGENVTLSCNASGTSPLMVSWIKVDGGERFDGSELMFTHINRSQAGEYRCEASNECGNALETATIEVQYKPENVQLKTSAIDSKACKGETISINCSADAVPSVTSYELFENDSIIMDTSGMWSKTFSSGGVFVYKCVANNSLGSMESESVTVTVNVPSAIEPIHNKNITEGGNITLSCSATGTPPPMVSWIKVDSHMRFNGSDLVFTNINRSEAGEYRCEANNECGNVSEKATIEVQYQPERVQLKTSVIDGKTCKDETISINCSADAVPSVTSYELFENDSVIMDTSGMWSRTLSSGGVFVYKCVANNSLGSTESESVTVTVNVPSSIYPIQDETITEGHSVTLSCNASGMPSPMVSWIKVDDHTRTNSSELMFTNINRNEAGEYKCEASNECGNASGTAKIFVQYMPEITSISDNQTLNKGDSTSLNCTANGYPTPDITWTKVSDNSSVSYPLMITGKQNEGLYRCTADNGIGRPATDEVFITVHLPSSIEPLKNKTNVKKGEDVTLYCNVSGTPAPRVSWTRVKTGEKWFSKTKVITDVKVDDLGEYKCEASNPYGNDTKSIFISFPGGLCEVKCPSGKSCRQFGQYVCLCAQGKKGTDCKEEDVVKKTFEVGIEFKDEFKPEYEDLENAETKLFVNKVTDAVKMELDGSGVKDVKVKKLRKGSVIADMEVTFNEEVGASEVDALLTEAAKDGKIGDLEVGEIKSDGLIDEPEEKQKCKALFEGEECKVDITRNTSAVVNVTEGESLTVNCSIGTDDPFWSRKDGGDVDTKTRKRDGVLLRIENASIADTGVYVCKHGKDQHTIWIQVLVQVEVEMELVVENYVFTEELKNKSSPEYKETEKNFTIEMDKVHRGVTPGYVRTDVLGFKKGSVQVDFKIVIVLVTNDPENETDLPDVKAETAQRVVVKAKTGFVERLQVKKVIVKTVPLEPANVEFFGIDSDELSVRWNPSEDADSFQVQRYEVHYRKFEEKLFTNVSQPASDGKTQYTIRIQPLEPETTYMIQVGAANDYGRNFNDESAHKTDPAPFAWWIIVVVVLIVLLVLVILVVLIVYKRKRDREREALQQGPRIDALELESAKHEIAAAESKNVKGLSYSYHNDAYKPSEVSWEEIPYENLKLLDELGSGAFGVVYKAEYLQENGNVLPCAVKSLKPSASSQEVHDLYNELEIMDNVGYHPNLVNLIGACTEDGHLLVVLEIAENGSLIEFLKKNRQTDQSNEIISGLTEQMKTRVATDVARGMAHLAKCRCIHRDLAARNVLLGKDYVAKVSDYGMARDVYEDLMYKKETQGKLPVKWMAIESLQTYIFTIESDVWSYGVLLWEIESGGLKPYAGLNTTELMEELKKGYRLEKPAGCSEDMYQVMRSCWNPNPSARPTFDQLVIQLESEIVT